MSQPGEDTETGARALVGTLADLGVTACFANPGTSEMHLVTALDQEPRIRSVLGLFEGVATGAADGFARIAGGPAMTLLHLGAGYLNGGANLHNARRAHTPMINVIGDHATYHRGHDAPLTSDIIGLAAPNLHWVKALTQAADAGRMAVEAWQASFGPPGGPVGLILPADSAWTEGGLRGKVAPRPTQAAPDPEAVEAAARAIRAANRPMILIGGSALHAEGLPHAARLEAAGVRVVTDTFYARQARGAGRFAPSRLAYFAEGALEDLAGHDLMVIAGTKAPVAFFAYPGRPSVLVPEGCSTLSLGDADLDSAAALAALADALGARVQADALPLSLPERPTGDLTAASVGASLARHMPEGAIVSDDGVSNGMPSFLSTLTARPHDWLMLTGGAIGQGLPLALGAAIAAPDRQVIALSGDGAAMYTNQALWSQAREGVNVVNVVFVNHSYRILNIELHRTGAGNPGPSAKGMLELGNPEIDWAGLSRAMGVPAEDAWTAEAFDAALEKAVASDGPYLIAAHVPG